MTTKRKVYFRAYLIQKASPSKTLILRKIENALSFVEEMRDVGVFSKKLRHKILSLFWYI